MRLTRLQLGALYKRTGAASICLFARGNLADTFEPNYTTSENAEGFLQSVLNHAPWDVCRMFEAWVVTQAKSMS